MKIIIQHDEMDCGAACFVMITSHYGYKMSVQMAREMTQTGKNGTTVYNIVSAANKIGFLCRALEGNMDDLVDLIDKKDINVPFVAHMKTNHFVVIEKCINGWIHIIDPNEGKKKIQYKDFDEQWSGYIITFEKKAGFKKRNLDKNRYSMYIKLILSQWRKLIAILFMSLFISLVGLMGTYLFQTVINDYIHNIETVVEENEEKNPLELLSDLVANNSDINTVFIVVIFLYVFQCGIQFYRGYIIAWLSKNIDKKLIIDYYSHLQRIPLSIIKTRMTGEYLSRFSDTVAIRDAISGVTVTLILDSFMMIMGGWLLHEQSPYLFKYTLIMIFLYIIVVMSYRKYISDINRNVMENNAKVQSYFKESIDGIETIRNNNATSKINTAFKTKFNKLLECIFVGNKIYASEDAIVSLIDTVGTTLLIWYGFHEVISQNISLGALVTFYLLLGYFVTPVKNLVELQPTIQKAMVSVVRLNDILNMKTEEDGKSHFQKLSSIETIEFRGVNFSYDGETEILSNFSLKVDANKKVALTGKSGCGKSTAVKLLLGLYKNENIFINEKKITDYSLEDIRTKIAYINQDTFLFSDTIYNNICLGTSKIDDDEINLVCKLCELNEFLVDLPLGLNTMLEENGMNLSGGQRQRIAIARALVRKPDVIIFDEATSNLDNDNEEKIKRMIYTLNKMCIIISHKKDMIQECDDIYVLENGNANKVELRKQE